VADFASRLRELSKEATPGPWDTEGVAYIFAKVPGGRPNGEGIATFGRYDGAANVSSQSKANAAISTLLRNNADAIAELVETVGEAVGHLTPFVDSNRYDSGVTSAVVLLRTALSALEGK
jgi:hypothetical protein